MPFKSEKQRRWMWANKPEMARRWSAEYKQDGGLLDGLQRPEINNLEDLQRVAAARNQELAAVAAELGISPQDLANVQGSSADQANDIARQIWGDNAPQLRQAQNPGESLSELAAVVGELAKNNASWGGNQAANPNAIEPAKQQGFWSWAGDQASGALEGAGSAFQEAYDTVSGATARQAENDAYAKSLSEMTPEELVEHLNQKYPQGAANQPQDRTLLERASDFSTGVLGALNPISDANAGSIDRGAATGLAFASLPNPSLAAPGVQQLAIPNIGLTGQGTGSSAVPVTNQQRIADTWGGATDDSARQTWKKGWFSDGFETETPQDIRARQAENIQGFEQNTGFNMPHQQEEFLYDRFEQEATQPTQYESEDRDYWGSGWQPMGSGETERNVTVDGGFEANAPTAQGDWEIQSLLNNPDQGLSDSYDDDDGWDSSDDDYGTNAYASPHEQSAEQDIGTNTYASPHEQGQDSGGGDDSGGGK